MKWYKKFFWFIKSKILSVILLIITIVSMLFISYLYNISLIPAFYTSLILATFYIIFLILEYHIFNKKYKNLEIVKKQANTYLGVPPEADNLIEKQYLDIIASLEEKWQKLKTETNQSEKRATEYYTMWSHQIKTPIAAIKLLLQEENPDLKLIETELLKIEQYSDMALKYTDLDNGVNDLVLTKYSLDKIVKNAVKRVKILFIQKKIGIEIGNLDKQILTDEKWFTFVLEQIFTNACKYTHTGNVSVYLTDDTNNLVIEDTGIGIKKEDIKRVFEWGYTGYNGRKDKMSTGIGLYLCKKTLKMLGNDISIISEVNKGTKVIININRKEYEIE